VIKVLILSVCSALLTAFPVVAAEKIYFTYSSWKGSIRVDSLETFAKDGTINNNLRFYLRRFSPEQQHKFRQVLVKRIDVSPVLLSRFFNSQMGEDILTRVGRGITIQGGRNGKYALRGAMIQAAFEPEGLTLLNLFRKFPTNMQLQGEYLLGLSNTVDLIIKATNYFTEKMAQISREQAQSSTVNYNELPNLREQGKFKFRREVLTLTDPARQRSFYVIFYIPQTWRNGKTPVAILSHGLASRPEDFDDVAEHLASYGYLVALPQHPGSDTQQKLALINGFSRELFEVKEFIDRPKDITTVIDELERRNQAEFGGQLDLENVGVAGHSFGGYTALAVAGAEIDFDHLKSVCERPFSGINISLLLQCRALSLPRQSYNFKDSRVKAVLAQNPVNSTIFGQKGLEQLQIPVMFTGGNFDPATPFVLEQVRAFTWLSTPNKYLGLAEGQAHINLCLLDAGISELLDAIPQLTLAESDLLKSYRNPIIIAFFEVYIAKNPQFFPFLNAAYGEYLSQNQPFKFYLIDSSSQPALQQSINNFQNKK